jgi:hypothetical protein
MSNVQSAPVDELRRGIFLSRSCVSSHSAVGGASACLTSRSYSLTVRVLRVQMLVASD